jgi:hypothetical protein
MTKSIILAGAILIAASAHAQTTGDGNNGMAGDTTRRMPMHRNWDTRNGGRDGRDNSDDRTSDRNDRGDRAGRQNFRDFHRPHIRYSQDQRQQLQAINTDYRKKTADLFNNDNLTLRQYKAGLIALQKEKKAKLQALLTPQQKDQLARHQQMAAENAQVRSAARLERLKIRLNLSDDQVATLKSKEQGLHEQMRSLHENDNLLPQQKMEQFRDLSSRRTEIIKSVLTPNQLSKFNEMEPHRPHHFGDTK